MNDQHESGSMVWFGQEAYLAEVPAELLNQGEQHSLAEGVGVLRQQGGLHLRADPDNHANVAQRQGCVEGLLIAERGSKKRIASTSIVEA